MPLKGDLRELSLVNLIQINCTEQNLACLRVQNQEQVGELYFERGDIVHATLDARVGEEVVYELLTWENGDFELEIGVPPPAHTVNTSWANLLLDGMRLIDEGAARWEVDLEESKPEEVPEMATKKRGEALAETLSGLLAASADIEGAVVVGTDGLVMAADLPKGVEEARVGASAAALLGLSKRTTPTLGRGDFTQGLIQGEDGNIIIVSAGERAVFVGLTNKDVNLGMVFLEAQDAAAAIVDAL